MPSSRYPYKDFRNTIFSKNGIFKLIGGFVAKISLKVQKIGNFLLFLGI